MQLALHDDDIIFISKQYLGLHISASKSSFFSSIFHFSPSNVVAKKGLYDCNIATLFRTFE